MGDELILIETEEAVYRVPRDEVEHLGRGNLEAGIVVVRRMIAKVSAFHRDAVRTMPYKGRYEPIPEKGGG